MGCGVIWGLACERAAFPSGAPLWEWLGGGRLLGIHQDPVDKEWPGGVSLVSRAPSRVEWMGRPLAAGVRVFCLPFRRPLGEWLGGGRSLDTHPTPVDVGATGGVFAACAFARHPTESEA